MVLCLFWLFQINYLRTAYQDIMRNQLTLNAASIIQMGDVTDSQVHHDLYEICRAENYCCTIYRLDPDEDNNSFTAKPRIDIDDFLQEKCNLHSTRELSDKVDVKRLIQELLTQEDLNQPRILTLPVYISNTATRDMYLLAQLYSYQDDQYALLLNVPIQPIDQTIVLLQNQLLIVASIVLVLAMIVAVIIANLISRPIVNVTHAAKLLADGNYTVQFKPGSFSEINQLSQTLNYAARGLSDVERLRRELIANVSHDLRTPLTLIRAYAEMLSDFSWENQEKREQHLGIIMAETERLSKLVRDLTSLSQLQTGAVPFADKPFDMAITAARICQAYEALARQRSISLQLQSPDRLIVFGDEPRIEQVLYNLINNAINYTPQGGEVTVQLTRRLNDWVRVSVRDTGRGIPEDQLANIWDRYYRVSERNKSGGTGLGLSIVRAILIGSGARFGATSRMNIGSTFWFELRTFPRPRREGDKGTEQRG